MIGRKMSERSDSGKGIFCRGFVQRIRTPHLYCDTAQDEEQEGKVIPRVTQVRQLIFFVTSLACFQTDLLK